MPLILNSLASTANVASRFAQSIVPAEKSPDPLRATTVCAVFKFVAATDTVLAVDPLYVVPELKLI